MYLFLCSERWNNREGIKGRHLSLCPESRVSHVTQAHHSSVAGSGNRPPSTQSQLPVLTSQTSHGEKHATNGSCRNTDIVIWLSCMEMTLFCSKIVLSDIIDDFCPRMENMSFQVTPTIWELSASVLQMENVFGWWKCLHSISAGNWGLPIVVTLHL